MITLLRAALYWNYDVQINGSLREDDVALAPVQSLKDFLNCDAKEEVDLPSDSWFSPLEVLALRKGHVTSSYVTDV